MSSSIISPSPPSSYPSCIEGLWKLDEDDSLSHVAAQLEGWLLRSSDPFPYLFLVALEAGSLLRAMALLLVYPFSWLLEKLSQEVSGIFPCTRHASSKLLVFIACAGLPLKEIEAVGRAVLPRFFAEDVRARAWKTFSALPASRRQLVSQIPRPFMDSFACKQLGIQEIIAPDLYVSSSGRCNGFLKDNPLSLTTTTFTSRRALVSTTPPPKFLTDHVELLHASSKEGDDEVVSMCDLQSPVIFHDGRLVQRPTPLVALLVLLWMPVGFILAVARVLICGHAVPFWAMPTASKMFGIRVVVKGKVPAEGEGVLIVSNHRTLLDPVMIAVAMARPVTALTYSLSRVSEVLSPIRTVRLERDAERDSKKLRGLIKRGQDVVVCPEGTTSREPLLLRFSALFAEVTDDIVPVAVRTHATLFHGTSVRGYKAMDPFFFLMNPLPTYELSFLNKLPPSMTCDAGGMSRYDVANHVQGVIASSLGFKCTSFTRTDKYRFLAGNDGSVGAAPMA